MSPSEANPVPDEAGTMTTPAPEAPARTVLDQSLWRAATVVAPSTDAPASTALDVTPPAPSDFETRYAIREVLGRGGMGEVRLCHDGALGRDVALKTILHDPEIQSSAARGFLREVKVQGQLEHPAIVPVYDFGVGTDGGLFFTMRRVRGKTLAKVLEETSREGASEIPTQYSRRRLLVAFVQVCLAVHYAHTRGVIHRDLKPANIMLGDFGEVYVLDWGVAGLVTDESTAAPVVVPGAELEGQSEVAGTLGYMAPEQFMGLTGIQDARTDVYALGTILYEILTHRRLLDGSLGGVVRASTTDVDARPSSVDPEAPPEFDAVCMRATAREPAARYASARELAATVERFLDGDRDLTRRRELANTHVQAAKLAAGRTHDQDPNRAEEARAEALREIFKALALDPEIAEARGLLAKLLVEVPTNTPPAVEAEFAHDAEGSLHHTLRFGAYAVMSWALTIPFVATMGVTHPWAFGLSALLCIIAAVYVIWMWKSRASRTHFYPVSVLIAALCASLSCWLGPFILVPVAGATTTIWMSLQADKRQRWPLSLIGGAGMVLPLLLELAGVVPRSFRFVGDTLVLFPRAIHLHPFWTVVALQHVSLSFCMFQPLLLGGLRDALSTAERKLWLQAWHLRRLAAGGPTAGG